MAQGKQWRFWQRSNAGIRKHLQRILRIGILGSALLWGGLPEPVAAADRIVVAYGIFDRSISIPDLATFVETGQLSPQLASYARILQLSDEQLAQIRTLLNTPADLNQVAVGQFLYTPQGKLLLKQLSLVIQTPSRRAGFLATRAALILAAGDTEEGLTLLNVLQQFPAETIRIDVGRGLTVAGRLNQTIVQSEVAIDTIQQQSALIAEMTSPEEQAAIEAAYQVLQFQRPYRAEQQVLTVPGIPSPINLYLPVPQRQNVPVPVNPPLLVISHGLGGTREDFAYLAEFLVTAGFAVVAVEHSGSNNQQLFALLEGQTNEVVPETEFIRRPQEISLTLDELARQANSNPSLRQRFDLNRVGVIGQSFGGYTALALTGAELTPEGLGRQCPPPPPSFNLSLLLQCQATEVATLGTNMQDPRIQAVFVMNPIGSALFGEKGYQQIDVPVMVVASAADTIAPAYPEQIEPFSWMTHPDRYLVLIGNGTHFSVIGDTASSESLPIPQTIIGPNPELARFYMQVLSLAFFKVYLDQDETYRPLLSAAFAANLAADPLSLSLITAAVTEALPEAEPGTEAVIPLDIEVTAAGTAQDAALPPSATTAPTPPPGLPNASTSPPAYSPGVISTPPPMPRSTPSPAPMPYEVLGVISTPPPSLR